MFAKNLRLCAVLALLAVVRGQGTISAKLSEEDYSTNEDDRVFNNVAVTVTGTQEGDVTFQIDLYTRQQFNDLSGPESTPVCNNVLDFPEIDEGEIEDVATPFVTCTRTEPPPGDTGPDVSCPINLANDNIIEGNEFLIAVLSVQSSPSSIVTLNRNCAVLRILAGSFDTTQFLLAVVQQDLVAVEGRTETNKNITIERLFETDLPIELSFRSSNVIPVGVISPFAPQDRVDFIFNGGVEKIIFPANQSTLQIPLTILSDDFVERTEYLTLTFTARINQPDVLVTDIAVDPDSVNIEIQDDDVLTSGFANVTSFTIAEGEMVFPLCIEIKNNLEARLLQRGVELFFRVDGDPSDDYEANTNVAPFSLDLEFSPEAPICLINFTAKENNEAEGPRTFRVVLFDLALERIDQQDQQERERHQRLNVISPSVITITITDNDGSPPNQPIIDTLDNQDGDFVVTWTRPDEENGLRPVDCYNGTIIRRKSVQVSESDRRKRQDDDDSTDDSEVFSFEICNPSDLQHLLENYDPEYTYEVVVCARNDFGVNCSAPRVFAAAPPTSVFTTAPPTSVFTAAPPPPVPALATGAIAGIVIAILLLACCLILILVLCLLWFCCWERERRYFPEKREKQFARFRHSAHVEVEHNEFDQVKVPLE